MRWLVFGVVAAGFFAVLPFFTGVFQSPAPALVDADLLASLSFAESELAASVASKSAYQPGITKQDFVSAMHASLDGKRVGELLEFRCSDPSGCSSGEAGYFVGIWMSLYLKACGVESQSQVDQLALLNLSHFVTLCEDSPVCDPLTEGIESPSCDHMIDLFDQHFRPK